MQVYQDPSEGFQKARVHPYISTRAGEAGFVDFKRYPEKIALALEDFVPLKHEPAIQTFFSFLTWLNGPDSLLESCDCALQGPALHKFNYSRLPMCLDGRLMLMCRDLSVNCDDRFNLVYNTLGKSLSLIDQEFPQNQGVVGFSASRALFADLIGSPRCEDGITESRDGDPGRGYQLMLHFKAFGKGSGEAFANLDRLFRNIEQACRLTSQKLSEDWRRSQEA